MVFDSIWKYTRFVHPKQQAWGGDHVPSVGLYSSAFLILCNCIIYSFSFCRKKCNTSYSWEYCACWYCSKSLLARTFSFCRISVLNSMCKTVDQANDDKLNSASFPFRVNYLVCNKKLWDFCRSAKLKRFPHFRNSLTARLCQIGSILGWS